MTYETSHRKRRLKYHTELLKLDFNVTKILCEYHTMLIKLLLIETNLVLITGRQKM